MQRIYLDYNATTPVDPDVLEAMRPYFTERFGNSMSGHSFGVEARDALEAARASVADLVGAPTDRLFFTSGGSESINWAIKGLAFARLDAAKRILVGATEHHAVEESVHWLRRFGFRVEVLAVDAEGRVPPVAVAKALEAGPALLVSVMWANNEVGTVQDVAAIGATCRRHGVPFIVDAVQAAGKVAIDVSRAPVDFLALGAHKFYGPKGVGALYVRAGVELENVVHGAGHESGRRAGTSNVAGAVGMGAASRKAKALVGGESTRAAQLRDRFEAGLGAIIADTRVNGAAAARLPNTSNVGFDGVLAQELLVDLDRRGIAASAGAACRAGVHLPSPTLSAMGLSRERALAGVRFCIGRFTDESAVDEAVRRIADSVRALRHASPASAAKR
ncbi:MAG: cysteine desulfurase [Planctomycetes bacterium]|nr:cysteine desulfurase [Planctomycetota bacterium]